MVKSLNTRKAFMLKTILSYKKLFDDLKRMELIKDYKLSVKQETESELSDITINVKYIPVSPCKNISINVNPCEEINE